MTILFKENDYKDGFHIMYPELVLDVPSRYFVYDKFMEILGKDNYVSDNIPHTNELGDIFDKSVIPNRSYIWFVIFFLNLFNLNVL